MKTIQTAFMRRGYDRIIVHLLAALILTPTLQANEIIKAGRFSEGSLSGWKSKAFAGETSYRLRDLGGKTVLLAESHASASGLFRQMQVDLTRTPYLNWCWQVIEPLPPLPERTKPGDDYAARIYLVKKGGIFFWKTKALNYVWSSGQARESLWPNAFAGDNVMMLAVRSRGDAGWRCEKRDLRADWRRAFGEATDRIDAVALMTDSDNSKQHTAAYYGDIWFSSN
ncbi:MAG: DUF3047 domain-containing protein [Methylohalobius crimeensis]